MFSHDTSGGLFTDGDDALKKSQNRPDRKLFSVLKKLWRFQLDDGKFHLKLCYPTLGGKCNEWTQTSNPATQSTVTDFIPIKLAFSNDFVGLGLTSPSASKTFIDATPSDDAWFYAIGAFKFWGKTDKIPGPVTKAGKKKLVRKVELYAEQPGTATVCHTAH